MGDRVVFRGSANLGLSRTEFIERTMAELDRVEADAERLFQSDMLLLGSLDVDALDELMGATRARNAIAKQQTIDFLNGAFLNDLP